MRIRSLIIQQHLFSIFCIFFALLLVATGLNDCWQWRRDWQLAHDKPTLAQTATHTISPAISLSAPNHLFGQSLASLGTAPISSLPWRVTAISKVLNEHADWHSKVAIAFGDQPSKLYQAGDYLSEGIRIHAITTDAVIVNNAGRLEKLPIARQPLAFLTRPSLEQP